MIDLGGVVLTAADLRKAAFACHIAGEEEPTLGAQLAELEERLNRAAEQLERRS